MLLQGELNLPKGTSVSLMGKGKVREVGDLLGRTPSRKNDHFVSWSSNPPLQKAMIGFAPGLLLKSSMFGRHRRLSVSPDH